MPHYDDIKKLVNILLAMRDPWNHHGERVAGMAVIMANILGLNASDVVLLEIGACMHDIGKLRVDAEVMNLPRVLTDNERAGMELHAPLGWAIAEQAGYHPLILDAIRHHHENWDGSGYPDNLQGEQIPMAARVIRICDVYDGMRSDRAYRKGYSREFVSAFMEEGRAKLFDPQLLDLFFEKVIKDD